MSDCTIHGPGCERLHVDDRVALFGRAEQTGTVVAVTDGGIFTVRFDNNGDELTYYESELVKLTPEGAILAVAKDILADPEWAARVVIAAIVAENELSRIKDVVVSGHLVAARVTLSEVLSPREAVS